MTQNIEMNEKTTEPTLKRGFSLSQLSSRTRRIIRYSLIVLCVLGLALQTTELFSQYLNRETVVNIKVEKNKYNSIPAITICYPKMLSMEKTAQKYPELKPLFDEYKKRMENVSENDYKNETFVKEMNNLYDDKFSEFAFKKSTIKELFELSIPFLTQGEGISTQVAGMRLYSNGSLEDVRVDDTNPVPSIAINEYGFCVKCFTFFSHLNETFREISIDIQSIELFVRKISKYLCRKLTR